MKKRLFTLLVLVLGTIGCVTAQSASVWNDGWVQNERNNDSLLRAKGYEAYRFGNYEEAYSHYANLSVDGILMLDEIDWFAYAVSCLRIANYADAILIYDLLIQKGSTYAHLLNEEFSKMYPEYSEFEEQQLKKLENTNPRTLSNAEIFLFLGHFKATHQYERTIDFCDEVFNYIGYDETVNYYKAEAYYSMGALTRAESCLHNILNISSGRLTDPASLSFFNQWVFLAGKIYYAAGDAENGYLLMNEAMNRYENGGLKISDYMLWGMCYYHDKQYEMAKDILDTILAVDKTVLDDNNIMYFSRFILANILQRQGFESAAMTNLKTLESNELLSGDNVFSHIACHKLGLLQDANEHFAQLLLKESMSEYDHYSAAYGYILRGNKEKAFAHAKLAIGAAHDPMWSQFFIKDDVFASIKKQVKRYMKDKEKLVDQKYPEKKYTYKQTEIPFYWEAGIMVVECSMNGTRRKLYFDPGATYSKIGRKELDEMYEKGHLTEDDILFTTETQVADGRSAMVDVVNIKEIKIGDVVIKDVRTTVNNDGNKGMLLLGQSVLTRFAKFEIDYENFLIRLTYKVEK